MNTQLEILHLGKYYWPENGGMETALQNLAEVGVDLGHNVKCVVSTPTKTVGSYEKIGQVEIVRYPIVAKLFSAPISPRFFRHRKDQPDILHVHLPNPIAEISICLRFLRQIFTQSRKSSALIPFLHSLPVNQRWIGRVWYQLVTRRILKRAKVILVSNQNLVKAFPNLVEFALKMRTVPFFVASIESEELARVERLRPSSQTVLALGRLVPYKGFEILIYAWRHLIDRNPNYASFRLNIVGEGPEEQALRQLISKLNLNDNVFLCGSCDEKQKQNYLKGATVFVASSINNSETFGISILEAMANALPVITTDLDTGVRVLSREGQCGAVAQAGDVVSLAQAIDQVLKLTPDKRNSIGRANLEFCNQYYSRHTSTIAYRNILQNALDSNLDHLVNLDK